MVYPFQIYGNFLLKLHCSAKLLVHIACVNEPLCILGEAIFKVARFSTKQPQPQLVEVFIKFDINKYNKKVKAKENFEYISREFD
jgi:hypothetical protein